MADRREQIVEAALELVESGGPGAASVRAVAERAGIGASTLRYYFPTQSALMRAVAERAYSREVPDLDIANSSRDPAERLTECMLQFLPHDDESTRSLLGIWVTQMSNAFGPEADDSSTRMLSRLYEIGLARIESWLHVLAAEGHLAEVDIPDRASLLSAACDGLMPQFGATDLELTLDAARRRLRWLCGAVLDRTP
ncbi:TetR/AcrR family transcriptional regulator [Brevibacterium gallinarum]|uniref:TetR/AcrR family transcriptional regulator n=1 Tax=Brevibacterium gallinarum TaxID=2762220 RepID=A0ABR8WV30_9MICO|nr:TetR/AcrR family transcriptional regulator [Brevibacterium gallinarum]MBD8020942.1 TetR/AcrR family transcriptional regulator [Brevibacterium gallinarum]